MSKATKHGELARLTKAADDFDNEAVLAFVEKISESPTYFVEECLNVRPREGGAPVPFKLNEAQRRLMEVVEAGLRAKEPIRVVVLKSRRHGISTIAEALGYWSTSVRPHSTGIVLAHKLESARELFRMTKLFYDTDARHKVPGLMPAIEASNERALRFANPDRKTRTESPGLQSALMVDTSEGEDVGRSLTLQFMHGSEVAFWKSPQAMAGLEIALSKTPGSIGILESTANGRGNMFEQTYYAAKSGKSEWSALFLPWSIDPNCFSRVAPGAEAAWEWETLEERNICERHGLSLGQMKWRRLMLQSPAMNSDPGVKPEDKFRQEYPLTDDEAFLGTGRCFFLPESLDRLEASGKGRRTPLRRGELNSPIPLSTRPAEDWTPVKPLFMEEKWGSTQIWEEPGPYDYAIGADVAEGLERGDSSVAVVLRRDTLAFVAMLKTRALDPDQFGESCALLGWFYNTAILGIERNGPGFTAVGAARRAHYSRLWFDNDNGKLENPTPDRIGWRTTSAVRRTMFDALESEIRQATLTVPSESFYAEARHFNLVDVGSANDPKTRPQAQLGKHDDEIMAVAIAVQMHLRGGSVRKYGEAPQELKLWTTPRAKDPKPKKSRLYSMSGW